MQAWKNLSMATKILIMVVLGVIAGLVFGEQMAVLKPIGDMFIAAVMMMVILLIAPALISGFTSVENPADLGKTGVKILFIFAVMTIIGGSVGLLLANILQPGSGLDVVMPEGFKAKTTDQTFFDVVVNTVPRNPVMAFAQGNLLQILFVTVLFAVTMAISAKKNSLLKRFFDEWTEIAMGMLNLIMKTAPYATFCLIAWAAGVNGSKVIGGLAVFVGAVWLGEFFLVCVNALLIKLFGMSTKTFLKNMTEVMVVGFSTCSSMATLGVNLKAVQTLGVPKGIGTFGITLGNVMNMGGTSLYQAVSVLFLAQIYNIDLSIATQIQILLTAAMVSVSIVGVPGAGAITCAILLPMAGIPVEGLGFILAIDRIVDMPRTMNNVLGDATATIIGAKLDGHLHQDSVLLPKGTSYRQRVTDNVNESSAEDFN